MKKSTAMKVKKPLQKGNPAMGSKEKPLRKGLKAKPATKRPLKRGDVKKLGQMSLNDKIKKIADETDDEVTAAMALKEEMTTGEKSKAWQKYGFHLNKNENERKEFEDCTKKEKGLKIALWLVRSQAPKFCTVAKQSSVQQNLCKKEKWLSEKQARDKWGDELERHLESGRVQAQETTTWGVWEYMDTQDWTRSTMAEQKQKWMMGQEYQQHQDEESKWDEHLETDLQSLLKGFTPGKGKGTGKSTSEKGKGKGKKGDRRPPPPALEDLPPDEQKNECLSKLRKTRDSLNSQIVNFEEALEKVKKMNHLTKTGIKEKEAVLKDLASQLKVVKDTLAKGDKIKLEKAKEVVLDSVRVLKDSRDQAKELIQITMRTASRAGSHK